MQILLLALFLPLFAQAIPARQLSDDFYLSEARPEISRSLHIPGMSDIFSSTAKPLVKTKPVDLSREACLAHIRQSICETDADTSRVANHWNEITCHNDHLDNYATILTGIYDELPARLQPSFCTLEKIFVSDNFFSIAFAASIVKPGSEVPVGGYIGLRRGTLEHQPTSRDMVSWKEQLNFGGSQDFLANDPKGVQLDYNIKISHLPADGLFYAVIHELGHLIDFNNPKVNEEHCRRGKCTPTAGSWGALSWQDISAPLPGMGFPEQKRFCYYYCNGKFMKPEEAYGAYLSLANSAFITAYSGMDLREDFAEFFTWNIITKEYGAQYKIRVPGSPEIDMNQVITQNPNLIRKLDYMNQFWNDPKTKIRNGL